MTALDMFEMFDEYRYIVLAFLLPSPFLFPFTSFWAVALFWVALYVVAKEFYDRL